MAEIDWIRVLFRWLHILPVIFLLGGAFFLRFALMPGMTSLNDETRDALRQQVMSVWQKVVHISAGLILVSGLYNAYLRLFVDKAVPTWHALFGIKFLLAIFVLFLASVLVGRSKAFEALRANAAKWLAIGVATGVVIVLLSGIMRYLPNKQPEPAEAALVAPAPPADGVHLV